MSDPHYDGLCGIPSFFQDQGGRHFRCQHEMGHGGDHSWKRYESQFRIFGGITHQDVVNQAARGNVAAQAILAVTEEQKQK